jgi:hypothetical protein
VFYECFTLLEEKSGYGGAMGIINATTLVCEIANVDTTSGGHLAFLLPGESNKEYHDLEFVNVCFLMCLY